MKNIIVGISDYKVAKDGDVLTTYALGSCVGICLYDRQLKIAGLAHIMLGMSSGYNVKTGSENRFADLAIKNMLDDMRKAGASIGRLTAKIAGGAQMFQTLAESQVSNIGQKNILAVKQVLSQNNISILAEDTGKNYGRTQTFDSSNGKMTIKSYSKGTVEY